MEISLGAGYLRQVGDPGLLPEALYKWSLFRLALATDSQGQKRPLTLAGLPSE